MSEHCSFRIGGPARLMLLPATAGEAAAALKILRAHGAEVLIVGSCTNLLVPDEGYPGAVVRMAKPASDIGLLDATHIRAQAGATLNALAVFAAQNNLTGLEFAHGIPGSVGGGVAMNAGAYGGEMRDVLESAEFVDSDGEIKTLSGGALDMSYRHSAFSDTDRLITGAVFSLAPGDGDAVRARMNELIEKRRASQPLDMPSAGSTFKRPEDGLRRRAHRRRGAQGLFRRRCDGVHEARGLCDQRGGRDLFRRGRAHARGAPPRLRDVGRAAGAGGQADRPRTVTVMTWSF